jgi:hypothetical protein
MTERTPPQRDEPVNPIPLLPGLAEFLRVQGPYACITQATSIGTAYVLKAPALEIARARGTIPVHIQHALYDHAAAPVVRTVLSLYDVPRHPLRFESFVNIADDAQRADFAALAEQDQLIRLFYDADLRHRLNKLVPADQRSDIPVIWPKRRVVAPASLLAATTSMRPRQPWWRELAYERSDPSSHRTTFPVSPTHR